MALPQLGNMVKFFDSKISFLFLTVMAPHNDNVSRVCSWTPSFSCKFVLFLNLVLKFVRCLEHLCQNGRLRMLLAPNFIYMIPKNQIQGCFPLTNGAATNVI